MKEALPKLARVGVLVDTSPGVPSGLRQRVEATAPRLALQLARLEARDADSIDRAFSRAAREHVGGVVVLSSTVFAGRKHQVVTLAENHQLPAMYEHRDFVEAGGRAHVAWTGSA